MTRIIFLLLFVPSCVASYQQNLMTPNVVEHTTALPSKNEGNLPGQHMSRLASSPSGEVGSIEKYQGAANESPEVYLERIKPQIEIMIQNLVRSEWKYNRHHEGLPEIRELLEIYTKNFPDDENAAFMNYLFGFIIAEMTHCGCHGSGHSPDEWRKAAQAFARSAFLANEKSEIPWPTPRKSTKIRLAAQRAHALCLSNIANPLNGQSADNWKAIAALEALKLPVADPLDGLSAEKRMDMVVLQLLREPVYEPPSRGSLAIILSNLKRRLLILSIAAGLRFDPYQRLIEIVKDNDVNNYDLAVVSAQMLIQRFLEEKDAAVRRRWVQQLSVILQGSPYKFFYSENRSCLQGLSLTNPDMNACKRDRNVFENRWQDNGRVPWELW